MEGLSFKPTTDAMLARTRRAGSVAPAAPRDDDGGAAAATLSASAASAAVIPLSRRPAHLRLDVLPFLLAYPALVACDLYLCNVGDGGGAGAVRLAVAVDLLFLSALFCQLALWLACQWDPRRRAGVAFCRGGSGMGGWTHALVVPAGQRAEEGGGGGREKKKRKKSSAVGGERPGIVPLEVETVRSETAGGGSTATVVATVKFRGWRYRCCRAEGRRSGGSDDDPPTESIWRRDGPSVGEIDEIDDEEINDGHSDPCRPPSFHRPWHPTSLPLGFYSDWTGHTSCSLAAALSVYGDNATDVPLPPYLSLLGKCPRLCACANSSALTPMFENMKASSSCSRFSSSRSFASRFGASTSTGCTRSSRC